jgi:hypothetical protein
MGANLQTIRFIANDSEDSWYDPETEAVLICLTGSGRFGGPGGPRSLSGLFLGYKDGRLDEEECCFLEFDLVDEQYFTWAEAQNITRIPRDDDGQPIR